MSKELIDIFIRERVGTNPEDEFKKIFRDFAREYTNKKGFHYYTINSQHIYSIIYNGLITSQVAELTKNSTGTKKELSSQRKILRDIKEKEINLLISSINILSTQAFSKLNNYLKDYKVEDLGAEGIRVVSSSASNEQLTIKLKMFQAIEEVLKNPDREADELTRLLLQADSSRSGLFDTIVSQTQFLHKGSETVGTTQAEILAGRIGNRKQKYRVLKKYMSEKSWAWYKNPKSRDAARELLQNAIQQVFGELDINWAMQDAEKNREVTIQGEFANFLDNPPGGEKFDWSKLRPLILKKIKEQAGQKFQGKQGKEIADYLAKGKGSQPFDDRLGAFIINQAINKLISDKKVRVKKVKQDKPKNYNSKSKGKKASTKKKIKAYTHKVSTPSIPKIKESKQTKPTTLNLNALKAQINARLSMTVIKNMGTPALENRTGRFARSVQVTDVIQTSKGFPSIGYSYQKYPYQTFEPGFKQGSAQRDPRTLIDRSIREIASELIVGRFYTRRV